MKNALIYKHKTTFGTVFLKSRKNGLNPESLYLEIYLKSTQKRNLEFLGLNYTGNPITDTKIKQEAIGKCINYVFTEKKAEGTNFKDFCFEQIAKIDKAKSRLNSESTIKKLHQFAKVDALQFKQINERFLLDFREWLLKIATCTFGGKPMKQNTADTYFNIVRRYANRAQRKGFISQTAYMTSDIPAIGKVINPPITFTEDEIISLQNKSYPEAEICKALMFQFACGQRWGDVKNITWEQIISDEGQYKIILKQEKTEAILPTFISKDLMNWVGKGKVRKGRIFPDLPLSDQMVRKHLQLWCWTAKIHKKVGTHTMRRSCATILYKKDVDLLTISKILGHNSTEMTRRYIGIDEKDIKKGLDKLNEVTNRFNFGKAA
jgi:integrase